MSKVLSNYTNSQDNNFNLFRFVASVLVIYSHSYPLSLGEGAFDPFVGVIGMSLGDIAVDVFFLISGFLVARSFFTRNNIIAFVWSRVLRIYPALIVSVIFCVLVVGAFFTTNSISEYFYDIHTYKYIKRNITLFWGVKYSLPGVFIENPFKEAVNGSLWTLPYEVKMYSYLAIISTLVFFFQKKHGKQLMARIFFIIAVVSVGVNILNHYYLFAKVHFVHLFSVFFTGSTFYLYRSKVYFSHSLFIIMLVMLLISIKSNYFYIVYTLILPYMLFYLVYLPSGNIRKFNKVGDYSYGLYIYAFPVQQSIAALIPGVTVTLMVVLSFFITLCLAILSWHLVEKKVLRIKGYYI